MSPLKILSSLLFSSLIFLANPASSCAEAPVPAPAADCAKSRYYMILFGGQGNILRPRTAHTWATYVKVTPKGGGNVDVEPFTISWLPATLDVRPWAIKPEPGVNLDLHSSLNFMSGPLQRISIWGPYEITEAYFQSSNQLCKRLENGEFKYRSAYLNPPDPKVRHCVHAVTITDRNLYQVTQPVMWFGEFVTVQVAGGLYRSGLLINPDVTHDWLFCALGIDPGKYHLRRAGGIFPFLPR